MIVFVTVSFAPIYTFSHVGRTKLLAFQFENQRQALSGFFTGSQKGGRSEGQKGDPPKPTHPPFQETDSNFEAIQKDTPSFCGVRFLILAARCSEPTPGRLPKDRCILSRDARTLKLFAN